MPRHQIRSHHSRFLRRPELHARDLLRRRSVPGTTNVFESYGHTNRFVPLTLGEELKQEVGQEHRAHQSAGFFPNLQQTGEYRFTFNIGTVTKVNKWPGWQNQFSDIYVSNPPNKR